MRAKALRRSKLIHRLKHSLLRRLLIQCSTLKKQWWWNYNRPLTEYQAIYFAWSHYFHQMRTRQPWVHQWPTNPQNTPITCTCMRPKRNPIQTNSRSLWKSNGIIKWKIKLQHHTMIISFREKYDPNGSLSKRRGKGISIHKKLKSTRPAWILMGQGWNLASIMTKPTLHYPTGIQYAPWWLWLTDMDDTQSKLTMFWLTHRIQ